MNGNEETEVGMAVGTVRKTLTRSGLAPVGGKTANRGISKNSWLMSELLCCLSVKSPRFCAISAVLSTMPAPTTAAVTSKKRKNVKSSAVPSSKRRAVAEIESPNAIADIQQLEDQISESRKYYNNIATLISMLNVDGSSKPNMAVAVALCRVFSRLIAGGNLTETSRAAENEKIIVAWLKERCREYQKLLLSIIRECDSSSQVRIYPNWPNSYGTNPQQISALTLCLCLINERATHLPGDNTQEWTSGLFKGVFEAVVEAQNGQAVLSEFIEKAKEFEDVRYYTFMQLAYVHLHNHK